MDPNCWFQLLMISKKCFIFNCPGDRGYDNTGTRLLLFSCTMRLRKERAALSFAPKRESWIEIKSPNSLQEQPKSMNQYDFIFSEYQCILNTFCACLHVFQILGDMVAGLMSAAMLPVVRSYPLAMPRELHSQSSTPTRISFQKSFENHWKKSKVLVTH